MVSTRSERLDQDPVPVGPGIIDFQSPPFLRRYVTFIQQYWTRKVSSKSALDGYH